MTVSRNLPSAIVLLALYGAPLFGASPSRLIGLGDLPGGLSKSTAIGVSADGTTICGTGSSTITLPHPNGAPNPPVVKDSTVAFKWRENTGMVSLGFLTPTQSPPYASPVSSSNCLSADGNDCAGHGTYKASSASLFSDIRAVRWNSVSTIFSLGDFSGGASFKNSECFGMSDDGSIIVGHSTSSVGVLAVRWTITPSGLAQLTNLGTIQTPPQTGGDQLSRSSTARAVSADGQTIVGSGSYTVTNVVVTQPPPVQVPLLDANDNPLRNPVTGEIIYTLILPPPYNTYIPIEQGSEAFVWRSTGGMQRLGDLAGGGWSSEALAVSADGAVIVGYGSRSLTELEGLIWANGVMSSVGDLPGGSTACNLKDVTADGSVAVGFGNDEGGKTAVIWDAEHGLRKLSSAMAERGISLAGWTLGSAVGISADGDVIVGNGINPSGDPEAWRLTGASALLAPAEPALPTVSIQLGKVLSFPTQPGNLYQAEYTMNLVNWLPLGEVHSTVGAAAPSNYGLVDDSGSTGGKFYRLRLLPGSSSTTPPRMSFGEGAVISFETEPGFVYQVKASTDLVNWTELGTPIQTSGDSTGISHSVFHPLILSPSPIPARCNYIVEIEQP